MAVVNDRLSPYKVNIEDIKFHLDTSDLSLVSGGYNVTVAEESGRKVIALPHVNLDVSIPKLILGTLSFKELEILNPSILFRVAEDGSISLGLNDGQKAPEAGDAAAITPTMLVDALKDLSLKQLVIRDAKLAVIQDEKVIVNDVPRIIITMDDRSESLLLSHHIELMDGEEKAYITGKTMMKEDTKEIEASIRLSDVPVRMFAPFHAQGHYVKETDLKLKGLVSLLVGFDGKVKTFSAELRSGKGAVTVKDVLPETIAVESLALEAESTDGLHQIAVKSLALKTEDVSASGTGQIGIMDGQVSVDMQLEAGGLAIDKIYRYWPLEESPDSRKWVNDNLSNGTVSKATARLQIVPPPPPPAPEPEVVTEEGEEVPAPVVEVKQPDVIDATLTIVDATVEYLPGFPKVTGVNGTVHITDDSLKAEATSGKSLTATSLSSAVVELPSFVAKGIPMTADVSLKTIASDASIVMGPEHLNLAAGLKLEPAVIKGEGEGRIKLRVPLYSSELSKKEQFLDYDVEATLTGLTQNQILGKWQIDDLNGKVTVNNKELTLDSSTNLQGIPSRLIVKTQFEPQEKTSYKLIANIPAARTQAFGFEVPEQITGTLGINADIVEQGNSAETQAKIDLTQATVRIVRTSIFCWCFVDSSTVAPRAYRHW